MPSPEIMASSAVVQAIKDSVPGENVVLNGGSYYNRPLHLPPEPNRVTPIGAHTLDSALGFLSTVPDVLELVLHVVSPEEVRVISKDIDQHNTRQQYLKIDCSSFNKTKFRFGEFQDAETFVIGLLSSFVDTDTRAQILSIVGNMRGEDVTEAKDDGFSQSVTTRKGVSSVAETNVPSIVALAPYRTFREIDQPESNFLLRFKRNRDGLPQVALFEADGGGWKHAAIASIAHYIHQRLSEASLEVPIIY